MIEPSTINDDIKVARFKGTRDVSTSNALRNSSSTTVTIVVVNDGETNIKLHIGVVSSIKSISDIEYLNGKKLITDTVVGLSSVSVGSYVAYTGNNGCPEGHCDGTNANYVSDTDMGYCQGSGYKFTVNGWRVAYKKDGSAYLVSAGAPECAVFAAYQETRSPEKNLSLAEGDSFVYAMYFTFSQSYSFDPVTGEFTLNTDPGNYITTTMADYFYNYVGSSYCYAILDDSDSQATVSTSLYQISSGDVQNISVFATGYELTSVAVEEISLKEQLNDSSLKYCNANYAYGGSCNSNNTWAMNGTDFKIITGEDIANYVYEDSAYLINNGGYYWFATISSSNSSSLYFWYPYYQYVYSNYPSSNNYGFRPVIRLSPDVYITGGSGT